MNTDQFDEMPPSLEALQTIEKETAKLVLRGQIHSQVADSDSLLGTTSDGVQLLLMTLYRLITQLNQVKTLADVRAASAPFYELAQTFIDKVEAGEFSLTCKSKGLEKVVDDIGQRAHAVNQVLTANSEPTSTSTEA